MGNKTDETDEQFRILHSEELRDEYRSPCIVRIVIRGGCDGLDI